MAQYSKKRQKELKQDAFRDNTLNYLERIGDRLAGKGWYILYALAGLLALAIVIGLISWRNNRKEQEARQALGRAIEISEATIGPPAAPAAAPASDFNYATADERARQAAAEFQKVADKYGEPFRGKAQYLAAVNELTFDRNRGMADLEKLQNNGSPEISAWSKFALAQAYEANGEYTAAAKIYSELAANNNPIVPTDVSKERLAAVYEKTGKTKEAVDLLYGIVQTSRAAKDAEGKPALQSSTAREAERRLQTLDPARYQQLPAAPSPFANLNM